MKPNVFDIPYPPDIQDRARAILETVRDLSIFDARNVLSCVQGKIDWYMSEDSQARRQHIRVEAVLSSPDFDTL